MILVKLSAIQNLQNAGKPCIQNSQWPISLYHIGSSHLVYWDYTNSSIISSRKSVRSDLLSDVDYVIDNV